MPYFKFLASTVPETLRGSQNFNSRSRDHLPIPWPDFAFCSLVQPVIYMRTNFEVSSFNRSRDMKGVLEFQK